LKTPNSTTPSRACPFPTPSHGTQAAYDRIFAEVGRVLKPGGRFVFSVNVPGPSWGRVALRSAGSLVAAAGTLKALKKGWRMMRYGRWLKREAKAGWFQYLPHAAVAAKLRAAGFIGIEHRVSYAGQAYVFRAASRIAVGSPAARDGITLEASS
jgi:SAM-dependent methyltransferase